ncbi:sulfatase-like hydrolase/transferase [Aeoliella sp. ICT_H6.2]|uniref:Sulfatase-like hydrolase/transferase n=1 Tax=Aeoliella straminimaris TaxID=2954799 RepID=A0A9X2JGR0_9BACT|nr:sulfatase-like hydrolase/transferase [Aeoliella straminimaris]MCO6044667.1 sulfatase-like hydrolase/transferase [Aeoliella straminimaris]
MKLAIQFGCAVTALVSFAYPEFASSQAPNIVHIFADDLGYGSVGFNGQSQIQTPNLDALAIQGMRFTNSYAATVCGPSRAMLYSGFHNGHTLVDSNANLNGDVFRSEGQMVGDYLQSAGYSTAVFGKWGFGGTGSGGDGLKPNPVVDGPNSIPTAQGFQSFYGYLDHARAHSYRVDSLWTTEEPADDDLDGIDEVGEKYQANADHGLWLEKTGNNSSNLNVNYSADLVTQKSLEYIESHAGSGQPFYLQYASTIPHFDIDALRNYPGWFDAYNGVPGAASWNDDQKAYAAMITRLDDAVGQLVAKLDDPDGDGNNSDSVLENTLILFSSDNGPTAEDGSPINFFDAAGGKRGGKRDLWDGGINTPSFAYWKGTIGPGQVSERYTDLPDFMPTALELAGTRGPVGLDGVSLLHELTGQGIDRAKDYIIQEHHEGSGPDPDGKSGRWAIIKDDFKLIKYSDGTLRLYNLETDPDENNELSLQDSANLTLVSKLQAIALAEGVEQSDSYSVKFHNWQGADGGRVADAGNWTGTDAPAEYWSALLANTAGTAHTAIVDENVTTLGFEVRGNGGRASQTVTVEAGSVLEGRNEVRISAYGVLELQQATLRSVRWVDVLENGQLSGDGQVDADLYNAGKVEIHSATGGTSLLRIDGRFQQLATGLLEVNVGGTTGGTQFDQLEVQGNASLAGTLDAQLVAGFIPQEGDFFPLLRADSLTGQFDTVLLPAVSGVELTVQYTNSLVLLVAGDLELKDGDINLDGQLDQLDVNAFVEGWLYHQPVPDVVSYQKGDLNLDGTVDRQDWRLLREAFINAGMSVPQFAYQAVPEPDAWIVTVLGLCCMATAVRRQSQFFQPGLKQPRRDG